MTDKENRLADSADAQPAEPAPDGAEDAAKPSETGEGEQTAPASGDALDAGSEAPAEAPKSADQSSSEPDGSDKPPVEKRPRRDVVRDNHRLKRQVKSLRKRLTTLEAEKPPDEGDFSDESQFNAAQTTHAVKKARADEIRDEVEATEAEIAADRREGWLERVDERRDSMPDFDQVFDSSVHVTDTMADVIEESELGPELAYHLGNNRSEARRIAGLSNNQQAVALGRLEATLRHPATKRTSTAPTPPSTVDGLGSKTEQPLAEATYDEYKARRMEQIKGRAQR